jgi:hypothetical protein
MPHAIECEVDRNFDFFQRTLGQYLPGERGKYALLRDCSLIQFYDTPFEAERLARHSFLMGCTQYRK